MSEDAADGLVWDCNAFTCRLFSALCAGSDAANLFVSPYCVAGALRMALDGARGTTAAELHRVVCPSLLPDEIVGAFEDLQRSLDVVRHVELAVAQRVWMIQSENASETFREINRWVDQQTRGRITEIAGRGAQPTEDALMVTSAIYFHGLWEYPFEKGRSGPAWFHTEHDKFLVPTMVSEPEWLPCAEVDGSEVVELPYRGGDFSAMVILPPPGAIARVEAELDAAMLARWGDSLELQKISIELPRFRASSNLELNTALGQLGVRTAFTPDADFSGFGRGAGLYLGRAQHRALVEVDERGTVATAVTSVTFRLGMRSRFVVNRPFLFLIRDRRRELVLFLGRIGDPRA